jgi:hypothetical protein
VRLSGCWDPYAKDTVYEEFAVEEVLGEVREDVEWLVLDAW